DSPPAGRAKPASDRASACASMASASTCPAVARVVPATAQAIAAAAAPRANETVHRLADDLAGRLTALPRLSGAVSPETRITQRHSSPDRSPRPSLTVVKRG